MTVVNWINLGLLIAGIAVAVVIKCLTGRAVRRYDGLGGVRKQASRNVVQLEFPPRGAEVDNIVQMVDHDRRQVL